MSRTKFLICRSVKALPSISLVVLPAFFEFAGQAVGVNPDRAALNACFEQF